MSPGTVATAASSKPGMKRNVNTKLVALASAGLLLAACGGDDGSESSADADADAGLFEESGGADSGGRAGRPPDRDAAAPVDDGAEQRTSVDAEAPAEAPVAASDDAADDVENGRTGRAGEGGLFDDEPLPRPDAEAAAVGFRQFVDTTVDPVSTFALDVDTGAYSIARRWLDDFDLPPIETVRPEEYVNAFDYDYRVPRRGLDLTIDGGPSPFDDDNHLVRVGVQAEVVDSAARAPAALTFVIDTSGSMDAPDRLGLVKESLGILVDELDREDTVAIVTYSDRSGVVLEPTSVRERRVILDAIDELGPGGSTNLEEGLDTGYDLARSAFREGGINRVVLASDGIANVGLTDPVALAERIERDADRGIDLVTIGFGMGDFNDTTMEQLADRGDGFYAYVDTEDEAERLFEDELVSTLLTVAKNAKIQVEFDPEVVEAYRLIGFENRAVHDDDFRDDRVDAGELGAGHQVTALYEVELVRGVDPDVLSDGDNDDVGMVALRWEDPDTGEVTEIDEDIDLRSLTGDWFDTAVDFRLATVVATWAEVLRDNPYADLVDIHALAVEADRLADELAHRDVDELAELVDISADLI